MIENKHLSGLVLVVVSFFICFCFQILAINMLLPNLQVDRVYLSSPGVVAVLDHEKKRTFVIRKEGLPDVGKALVVDYVFLHIYS